jgi:nitrate/nitrite-specific signal transduction histidine kinase
VIAVLGIHVQTDRYVTAIQQAVVNLISLMALCITAAFILAYLMAHSVLKPLRQLLRGVEGISSHDFINSAQQLSNRSWHDALPVNRSDELGTLAEAFSVNGTTFTTIFCRCRRT